MHRDGIPISPDLEEWLDREDAIVLRREIARIPPRVLDAINILRHEKIGRWNQPPWVWEENPQYDRVALAVSKGKRDRNKQDALYVRLAEDGGIASKPKNHTSFLLREKREQAERFARLTERILDTGNPGLDYERITNIFKRLFSSLPESA